MQFLRGHTGADGDPAAVPPADGQAPRTLVYSHAGCALALLSVAGLLGLRGLVGPGPALGEGADRAVTLYVLVTNLVLLVGLGALLGRREDRLRAQSITDPLTGLTNRRYFSGRLHGEIQRCSRSHAPLALLLIDVDHLKQVNDRGGHAAGDVVLRAVAAAIARICRATDVVARLGGDEFAVLAPCTSAAAAMELASRLRAALREPPRPGPPVTVSIGVSDLEQVRSRRPEALLGAADMALYEAKDRGRDQVAQGITALPRSWAPRPAAEAAGRAATAAAAAAAAAAGRPSIGG